TTRLHMQALLVDLWREAQATVFFVTHSIEEAVYLGDRVYVFSSAPGTILREMEVPPPDRPPKEMQREPAFIEAASEARDLIDALASSQRAGDGFVPAPPRQPPPPPGPRSAGIGDYVREAFLFRWNLLLLIGGTAAAAMTPLAPVLLPLVAAGELTYLTGLISIPRFRAAIDAKVHAAGAAARSGAGQPAAPPRAVVATLSG